MGSPELIKINREEKIELLNNIREKVNQIVDALGKPIDEGIKETVVFLTALGIPTEGSCEGHIDHGYNGPWVDISYPNMPEERFIGERETYEEIAKKYNVSIEEIKKAFYDKSSPYHQEIIKIHIEISKRGETDEFKKWREENKKLYERVKELLEEFYKDREVEDNVRLIIEEYATFYRIKNAGSKSISKEMNEEERKIREERLNKYQKEMREFTEFLKRKFFELT